LRNVLEAVYDLTPIKENGLMHLHDHMYCWLIKLNWVKNVHVNMFTEVMIFQLCYFKIYWNWKQIFFKCNDISQ